MRACDLKNGSVVDIDGIPHIVEQLQVQTPSARGGATLYKVRFRNVRTKQKVDRVFKGDDPLKDTVFERRQVQYLYKEPGLYTFMDAADYSQFTLSEDEIENEIPYLVDGLEGITALIANDQVIGIEVPPTVELTVTECDPSIRGASVTARTKPATLETGHVVQVPEYLSPGELIKVDTRTGKFLSRA